MNTLAFVEVQWPVFKEPYVTHAGDIADAFDSLQKGSGFLSGPCLSMIILEKDKAHRLMATGTRDGGFILSLNDGDADYSYNTDMNDPISVAKTIRIFHLYAQEDDWGRSKFKWDTYDARPKPCGKITRLLVIGVIVYIILFAIKHIIENY